MNVWFVNHYAHPPTEAGGTRHHSLAKVLSERGHETAVIAASFDHFGRATNRVRFGKQMLSEEIDGVRWVWIRTPSYRRNSVARILNMLAFGGRLSLNRRKIIRAIGSPDVVVGSTPHPFGAAGAARSARRAGAAFVFEVRDLWPETLVHLGGMSRSNPGIRYLARLERRLFRAADRIVTLLPRSLEYITANGGDSNTILWLPNGVDLSMMPAPRPREDGETFSVLYAGAHGLSNALDRLLDAARLLPLSPAVSIRLLGEGPEKARLRERVRQEGIENVFFDDPVPKHAVYSRLQAADAFVLILEDVTLYRWGMSVNKLFDYMASARPVIVVSNADYDPVEEAAAGIRVRSTDPHVLAEAINSLVGMEAKDRTEMGTRGRAYVERHHDIRSIADEYERLFAELSTRKGRPTPPAAG